MARTNDSGILKCLSLEPKYEKIMKILINFSFLCFKLKIAIKPKFLNGPKKNSPKYFLHWKRQKFITRSCTELMNVELNKVKSLLKRLSKLLWVNIWSTFNGAQTTIHKQINMICLSIHFQNTEMNEMNPIFVSYWNKKPVFLSQKICLFMF